MYVRREFYTQLLLGPRYAMLRREFARWRGWKREISPVARKVLVTMGGSDPENITARAVEALRRSSIEGLEAAVVIGGSNPHREALERIAENAAGVRFHQNVAEIGELMAWADAAISAAGATCWEMCLLGLPSLLIDLAPNQRPLAEELQRRGAAIHLGNLYDTSVEKIAAKLEELARSPEARGLMSARARELVDGKGAARVVSAMRGAGLRLRRAEQKDCRMLWEWANDPEVRAASFSTAPIPWETHRVWFAAKLTNPDSLIYIVTDEEGGPVGEIRYAIEGTRAVVSLCLGPDFRGKGYGPIALELTMKDLRRGRSITAIDAFVKPGNAASLRLFESAGFRRRGEERKHGELAVHLIAAADGAK
jgi:UDP-2,4-diacetamido-2,4,6-trideoxy-beta-L-altropyranose hydrolase